MAPSRGYKWQAPAGRAIIQQIVRDKITIWTDGLHNWQLDIVARILDREDALCITATGDGKSAIFSVPIIVLLEVSRNPGAYPGYVSPKKPVGIVIAPTKGLANNIVHELEKLQIPALACTSETLTEARKAGLNLTADIAACRWSIICVDPEHLIDKQWEDITDSAVFRDNVVFACVDEAHLIDEWGTEFRPAFQRIGPFLRGRLPPHISVFGLTATLQPGVATKTICRNLGFHPNMFHLLRRSNERINVQFLIERLTHGLGGTEFPDLLKYLLEGRKAIIYCATIELCWRVFVYLIRLLPPGPHRLRRIRLYHAMCWPDENETTVQLIRDDPLCQVIVATVAFGQGFNVKSLFYSLQLGVPKTVPQALQQGGRVARDPSMSGRTIIFAQASAYAAAEKYLEATRVGSNSAKSNKKTNSLTTMNNEKALMLTTKQCLIAFFNKLYGNTSADALLDCITAPRRFPCSICLPKFVGPLYFPYPPDHPRLIPFSTATPSNSSSSPSPSTEQRPQGLKLKKQMRSAAELHLRKFKDQIYSEERSNVAHGFTPASAYLNNPTVTSLLDNFFQITSLSTLSATIPKWKFHSKHGPALLALISGLQLEFKQQFEAERLERNEKNRLRARAKRSAAAVEKTQSTIITPAPSLPQTRFFIRLPPSKRPLEDTTNIPPQPKRPCLGNTSTKDSADSESGTVYKSRTRRGTENQI